MDVKNLIMAVIGIAIAGLMIGAALLPAVDSATKTNMDVEQNTTIYFSALKDYGGEVEITPTGPALVINGVENPKGFIASSNYYLEYFAHSTWFDFKLYSKELGYISKVDSAVIHENGTVSITVDGVTQTTTTAPDWVFIPNPNGDWGNFRNTNLKVTYDQVVYSTHVTYFGDNSTDGVLWSAKILNGVYLDIKAITFNTDPATNAPINLEIEDKKRTMNNGYYSMTSSAVLKWDDKKIQDNFAIVFAPIEYKVETQEQGLINGIFSIIPLVAIAGLIVSAVYIFISRK